VAAALGGDWSSSAVKSKRRDAVKQVRHKVICAPTRGKAMSDSDLERQLNEAVKDVPPEKAMRLMKNLIAQVFDGIKETIIPQTIHITRHQLGYTDAVVNAVNEIAHRTSDSREEVLLKALSLYETAIEAKQKDQRLVLVGPEYKFIREIIGFDQINSETHLPASAAK
jgi:hypothetical protein